MSLKIKSPVGIITGFRDIPLQENTVMVVVMVVVIMMVMVRRTRRKPSCQILWNSAVSNQINKAHRPTQELVQ